MGGNGNKSCREIGNNNDALDWEWVGMGMGMIPREWKGTGIISYSRTHFYHTVRVCGCYTSPEL